MKKLPIDKMLCLLERRADLTGDAIDENPDYVFICEVVAAFELTGKISWDFKEQVFYRLRKLFEQYNLDFGVILAEILLDE